MNLSQLNKLAFIGNIAFLTSIFMRFYPFLQGSRIESLVILSGLIVSPLVNLLVNGLNFYQFTKGARPYAHFVQAFNAIAFSCQIILFLFFSGWVPLSNINS